MRILFLTDYWFPKMTANTLCVNNVAEELIANGDEVFVCSYLDGNNKRPVHNGIHFTFIRPTFARRLLQASKHCERKTKAKALTVVGLLLNRVRRALLLPVYPIVSLSFPLRWRRLVSRVISNNNIDTVVSVVAPEESLFAGYLVKKKNPEVDWVVYYIDSGTNVLNGISFSAVKRRMHNKAKKWENRVLESAKRIIVMEGHSKYYNGALTDENRYKLRVANVPLLKLSSNGTLSTTKSAGTEKWVYTGNLSGTYYDPKPFCDLFLQYRKNHNVELHLYGPSDHREYLESICKEKDCIYWHGIVNHDQIPEILSSADLLVYFVCCELDSVSGKFFEYLGYGKRILYYGHHNDINSMQVAKYNRGLAISMQEDTQNNVSSIEQFLSSTSRDEDVNVDELKENYSLSLPKTTADLIAE